MKPRSRRKGIRVNTRGRTTTQESTLPTNRAFVVQFRAGAGVEPGPFAGRVEHIVSGQATHFHSLDELVAFIARVLADVRE